MASAAIVGGSYISIKMAEALIERELTTMNPVSVRIDTYAAEVPIWLSRATWINGC